MCLSKSYLPLGLLLKRTREHNGKPRPSVIRFFLSNLLKTDNTRRHIEAPVEILDELQDARQVRWSSDGSQGLGSRAEQGSLPVRAAWSETTLSTTSVSSLAGSAISPMAWIAASFMSSEDTASFWKSTVRYSAISCNRAQQFSRLLRLGDAADLPNRLKSYSAVLRLMRNEVQGRLASGCPEQMIASRDFCQKSEPGAGPRGSREHNIVSAAVIRTSAGMSLRPRNF